MDGSGLLKPGSGSAKKPGTIRIRNTGYGSITNLSLQEACLVLKIKINKKITCAGEIFQPTVEQHILFTFHKDNQQTCTPRWLPGNTVRCRIFQLKTRITRKCNYSQNCFRRSIRSPNGIDLWKKTIVNKSRDSQCSVFWIRSFLDFKNIKIWRKKLQKNISPLEDIPYLCFNLIFLLFGIKLRYPHGTLLFFLNYNLKRLDPDS